MIKVLGFDEETSIAAPGNHNNTIKVPAGCMTASHVAGPNETAIFTLHVFFQRDGVGGNFFYVNTMTSTTGAASFLKANKAAHGDATTNQNGQASLTKAIPLTAGQTYIFGAGIGSNDAEFVYRLDCTGTVTIVRTGA